MTREKIEDTLLAMGIPAGVKGFVYIADVIEEFDKNGTDVGFTKELYPSIADQRGVIKSSVERAIRHALDIARSPRGNVDIVQKYIGTVYTANFHSLKQLYMMLKREESD